MYKQCSREKESNLGKVKAPLSLHTIFILPQK